MDTQLSFLETEKKERNETNMARILTIDYYPAEQVSITELMTKSIPNSTVTTARYDIEGMKKVRAEQPDILLLDWNADETSCIEILKNLRSDGKTKHIPLIVFTKEQSDSETRGRILELGASAFLGGPIAEGELVAQVNALLNLKREKEILRPEKQL